MQYLYLGRNKQYWLGGMIIFSVEMVFIWKWPY